MSIVNMVLVISGIAIGFLGAWIFGAGQSLNMFSGILLLITGGIIGFVIEWWIDESIRKNRELQRQLTNDRTSVLPKPPDPVDKSRSYASPDHETLSEILQQLKALQEGQAAAVVVSDEKSNGRIQNTEALAEILRQHKEELHQLSQQLSTKDTQIEVLRQEHETYQQSHPDDLTQIKGIGPVYQRKLRDIGIGSFKQLAGVDSAQIRRMLGIKKWQRVDIESWVEQARDWAQHV